MGSCSLHYWLDHYWLDLDQRDKEMR